MEKNTIYWQDYHWNEAKALWTFMLEYEPEFSPPKGSFLQ